MGTKRHIKVLQIVHPSDGSPVLPIGEYIAEELKWIARNEKDDFGLATFLVTEGPEASDKRRIAVASVTGTFDVL